MGRVCLNEEGWKGLESVGNEKKLVTQTLGRKWRSLSKGFVCVQDFKIRLERLLQPEWTEHHKPCIEFDILPKVWGGKKGFRTQGGASLILSWAEDEGRLWLSGGYCNRPNEPWWQ